jgi:putative phage-type endonuclease
MTFVHDLNWHLERQRGIGASQAAAIIGVSPWQTPKQVYDYLTTEYTEPEGPTPLRLWLGLRLEPVIAELFEAREGVKLRRPPKRYWHRNGVMHCELDYLVTGQPEHVECKVANFGDDWGPDGSTEIPIHYYPQVQAQLAVTGNLRCHVAVLYHGQELRVFTIERDPDYIADLETVLVDWYQTYVLTGTEPPLIGRDIEVLRQRYPSDDGTELIATPEQTMAVERLRLARLAKADATADEDNIKAELMSQMGAASKLVGPGFSISYKQSKPSTKVEWELVAKAYRKMLDEGSYEALAESLDAVETLYTSEKAGNRPFAPTWKGARG